MPEHFNQLMLLSKMGNFLNFVREIMSSREMLCFFCFSDVLFIGYRMVVVFKTDLIVPELFYGNKIGENKVFLGTSLTNLDVAAEFSGMSNTGNDVLTTPVNVTAGTISSIPVKFRIN